jgi:DNA invertase Pin-like site-specific DNA recombinase
MGHGATERSAVAYIRADVRAAHEGEAPNAQDALDAQRAAIAAWAARERVQVASWQLDIGVSGATPIAERPGLIAAYRALREHRANVLVAATVERFAHDTLVAWLIEREALTYGATVHTADGATNARESAPASEDGAYTRGALGLARAYERVVIRSRTRAALASKKARGERVGAVPYGYRLAADGIHLEADDAEQAVLKRVRELSGEGLSQRAIVAHLASRGVAGRTGAPLQQTQVARMLLRSA